EHTTGSTFDKHVHAEVEASTKTIPVVSWFGVNAGVAVGMGKSWFNTNTNTLGQTTSRYGDTGQAKMINVDNVNFDLTVDAEKCLAIKAS
ncbi:hypothetical protein, partial [Pseudomonas sp. GW531-E2]|uniref:hypothetical protein n=1 Tax=Pseudomonas sp. GW531-E2 TaxID=2070679 RepID=UPI001C45118D